MELPHIGDHCTQPDCNQLDYLPITCNLCNNKFCITHHSYEAHLCPERHKIDVRIPICPVCENPVSSKRGQPPDLAVNEHLEKNCQSTGVTIYKNKCSVPRCKQREVVSVKCDECHLSFCLRHRHACDHDCKGAASSRRELTLNGSIFKNWMSNNSKSTSTGTVTSKNSNKNKLKDASLARQNPPSGVNGIIHVSPSIRAANVSTFQGNLTEEEALERAILASAVGGAETDPSPDDDMARAIAESIEEQNKKTILGNKSEKSFSDCTLS